LDGAAAIAGVVITRIIGTAVHTATADARKVDSRIASPKPTRWIGRQGWSRDKRDP
jgi:hypothetical protein